MRQKNCQSITKSHQHQDWASISKTTHTSKSQTPQIELLFIDHLNYRSKSKRTQMCDKANTRWCVDLCVVFSSGGPSQVWHIYYKTAALKENITNTQTLLSGELRCLTHMPHITHTHKVAWWYMDWLALIDWWIMTRCDSAGKDADGSNERKKACVCVKQMLISPNEIFKSSLRLIK